MPDFSPEPTSPPKQPPPTEGEAAELVEWLAMLRDRSAGLASNCYNNNLSRIIALLQQRYLPPTPPADGEVAELVELMELDAKSARNAGALIAAATLTRAIGLLKQRHPAPVAVSEQPWEREGWCDESGRCWMGWPGGFGDSTGLLPSFRYCRPQDSRSAVISLPFHALPLPAGEGENK